MGWIKTIPKKMRSQSVSNRFGRTAACTPTAEDSAIVPFYHEQTTFLAEAFGCIEPSQPAEDVILSGAKDLNAKATDIRRKFIAGFSRELPMYRRKPQICFTRPWSVARVLRTSNNTRIMPKNGMSPATITIGSKERVAVAWRASEKWPINSKATMVPIPAAVPLSPLTVATALLWKRSVGRTFAMVEKEA